MVNSVTSTDPSVAQASSAANATTNSTTNSGNQTDNLASEQTFLKLFVAQLQNQDPLNPNQQDPTQMVSELAQFSQLEQMVNLGSQVGSIYSFMTSHASTATNAAAAQSSQTNSQTSNQTGATQGA